MRITQTTSADFSQAVTLAVQVLANACKDADGKDRHHWGAEQQTGHRVCMWCNYCEGGC